MDGKVAKTREMSLTEYTENHGGESDRKEPIAPQMNANPRKWKPISTENTKKHREENWIWGSKPIILVSVPLCGPRWLYILFFDPRKIFHHRGPQSFTEGRIGFGVPNPSFLSLYPSVVHIFFSSIPGKFSPQRATERHRGENWIREAGMTTVVIVSVIRVHWRPFAVVFQTQKIPGRFPGRGSLSL